MLIAQHVIINFDSESGNAYGSFPCPPTNNGTYQSFQPLTAFDGEDPNGTWTLIVQDLFNLDGGTINAWTLKYPRKLQVRFIMQTLTTMALAIQWEIQACSATGLYLTIQIVMIQMQR
ncbi:MAG: proprotein convertase P-domain-containing protein [Saprospiraceae bacterium]|nr:proprotein convertase P-domain-containing protein [Saprospiraceae bacterium]